MENAPIIAEDSDETSETSSSKKKSRFGSRSAEVIDLLAFKAKKAEREKPESEASLAERPPAESGIAESEPVPEAEAPIGQIGETEKPVILQELIKAAQVADAERPHDPDASPETEAGDAAVEYFRDLVANAGETPDIALTETLSTIGVEADEIAELTSPTETATDNNEEELEDSEDSDEETGDESPDELSGSEVLSGSTIESDEDDGTVASTGGAGGASSSGPGSSGSAGSSGGSGSSGTGPSPGGPTPPFGPMPGPAAAGGPGGGGPGTPNFNTWSAPATPNLAPPGERYYYGNPAAGALLGLIVGYLIGRRRGRIKTEKKLLPIQKRLKNQVEDLQWDLKAKEDKIRRVAAEKVTAKGPVVIEKLSQAAKAKAERSDDRQSRQESKNEQAPGAPAPEHIGHMLITANETAPANHAGRLAREAAARPAKTPERPAAEHRPSQGMSGKRIETLSRAELLSMSEQIIVDGSSLRQIYESHLVGEQGLRRLVAEHLRGGDLKKALRREVVEREIDFERDPDTRDMTTDSGASGGGASNGRGKEALNALLEKAAVNINDSGEEAAFFKARALFEASQLQQHKERRRMIDFAIAGTVTILLAVILVLYLTRN